MWEINNLDQLLTISVSLIYGGLSCVFYDIIRAIRKSGANSFFAVFFGDIFFFTVCGVSFFFLMLARTAGQLRGYMLLSAVLGFLLFRISFSKLTFPLLTFLFKNIFCLYRFLLLKTADLCDKAVGCISRFFTKIPKCFKGVKKCLKNGGKVLYNNEKLLKSGDSADEC